MDILRSLSNTVMVYLTVQLIIYLGISKPCGTKRILASIAVNLLLAAAAAAAYKTDFHAVYLIVYLLAFALTYEIVFVKLRPAQFYTALLSEFVITLLASCPASLIFNFTQVSYLNADVLSLLFFRLAALLAAAGLNRFGKSVKPKLIIKLIPGYIFALIAAVIICIAALTSLNNYPADSSLKPIINSALVFVLTASLTVMIFSLLTNTAAQKHFSYVNSLLKKNVETQLKHYESLERLDGSMRRFRHDYLNHMHSLLSLLKMKQYGDAEKYIEKLIGSDSNQGVIFRTGNRLADAILTEKSVLCRGTAEIVFDGHIPCGIDNTDLCIILSNLLDNAAEACAKLDGASVIDVAADERHGYFVLTVKNPTDDARTYSAVPETTKQDASEHGFGLMNVTAAAASHEGIVEIQCKNMVFEISLTYKI